MEESGFVRPGSPADARACLVIYQPYIEDTAITFETEVPGADEMAARIAAAAKPTNGRELYAHLQRRLTERGYRRAFAGITQPNETSNAFHRSFGFRRAGLFRRVGWKNGGWRDVAWMQLDLLGAAEPNGQPTQIT
jgi:L-amino acid N-acyltransferase YncA